MAVVEDRETYKSMVKLRKGCECDDVGIDCQEVTRVTQLSVSLAPAITRDRHATALW